MRFILRRSDLLYFSRPHGPDNSEWVEHPQDAHGWVDLDACIAAARTWKLIHGIDLEVLQHTSGPHHSSVTAPGTPTFAVSHRG